MSDKGDLAVEASHMIVLLWVPIRNDVLVVGSELYVEDVKEVFNDSVPPLVLNCHF
jgi:hypothetical protein